MDFRKIGDDGMTEYHVKYRDTGDGSLTLVQINKADKKITEEITLTKKEVTELVEILT